jgi:deazaflavin-dependent oxidoreductase (nitroreductase family)
MLRTPIYLYRMGLGGLLNRTHIMILVTRGRRSGLPRYTAIEYRRHGSKTYLISAWGDRPDWVKNIAARPAVTVQQGSDSYSACAELVTNPGEALRALHLFRRRAPAVYDSIFARLSAREALAPRDLPDISPTITVIRIQPQPGSSDLPPLPSDLIGVLPMVSVGLIALVILTRLAARRTRNSP